MPLTYGTAQPALPVAVAAATACLAMAAGCHSLLPRQRRDAWRSMPAAAAGVSALAMSLILPLPEAMRWAFPCGVLAALAAIDLAVRRLPDILTLPLLLAGAALSPVEPDLRVAGIVLAGSLPWLTAALFRHARGVDGLGFGDVKLAAACGGWVGVGGVGPLLLTAALLALAAVSARRALRAGRADGPPARAIEAAPAIAFGPFLAVATILVGLGQALAMGPLP